MAARARRKKCSGLETTFDIKQNLLWRSQQNRVHTCKQNCHGRIKLLEFLYRLHLINVECVKRDLQLVGGYICALDKKVASNMLLMQTAEAFLKIVQKISF